MSPDSTRITTSDGTLIWSLAIFAGPLLLRVTPSSRRYTTVVSTFSLLGRTRVLGWWSLRNALLLSAFPGAIAVGWRLSSEMGLGSTLMGIARTEKLGTG